MSDQTRQYGEKIEHIRADHVYRYLLAADRVQRKERVLDIACGCGYGSWLLTGAGNVVTGVDICSEAIAYAEQHYSGPRYLCQKAEDTAGEWDAVVTLETLEHLDNPLAVLTANRAPLVIASVPNEDVYPFSAGNFAVDEYPHKRHYTPTQFDELLEKAGLKVAHRWCQKSKHEPAIVDGTDGAFLIYEATR